MATRSGPEIPADEDLTFVGGLAHMTRRFLPVMVPVLLFALPFLLLNSRPPAQRCEILLDMQAGDSPAADAGYVEVYINGTAGEPLRQSLTAGVRRTYQLPVRGCPHINFLRLDPTNIPNLPVRVYGLRVVHGDRTLGTFAAADLAKWGTNCDKVALQGEALLLQASHGDPILEAKVTTVQSAAGKKPKLLTVVWNFLFGETSQQQTMRILVLSVGVVLSLGLFAGSGRVTALLVGLAVPLTWGALTLLGGAGQPPTPAVSVGYACFAGDALSLRWLQVALLVLVPALVALLVVGVRRLLTGPAAAAAAPAVEIAPGRRLRGLFVMAVVAFAVVCYFFPNLAAIRAGFGSSIGRQWDADNWLVWQNLIQTGARPWRDFWFPYSGQAVVLMPFPHGELAAAAHRMTGCIVLLLAVYLTTGRRTLATLGVFGTVFGLCHNGFCGSPERYILLVNVALSYIAINRESRRLQWAHALFWVAVVHAGFMEPTSVLYVGFPLAAACGLDALRRRSFSWRGLCGRLCRELAVPAMVFAGVGIWLAARGQLLGFLEFMLSIGTQANYGAFPIDLPSWLRCGSPSESFVLWSVVLLTAVGLGGVLARPAEGRRTSLALLLLGLTCAFLMLKQFVRPHIADQITIIPVVGVALYVFAGSRQFNVLQRHAAYFCGGLLFATLLANHVPAGIAAQVRLGPARMKASVPMLALANAERRAATVERFAAGRFQGSEGHQAVLWTLRDRFAQEGKQPLFVLSDDAVFYPMLGVRPYFHTNFYNGSPIEEQRHILRLLEENPPRYVIWRPGDTGVDAVPPVVRAPLVYEHVIEHYVPQVTLRQFEVLRRRLPGEPVALEFWRQRLGSTVQLGHIARFSSLARFKEAASESADDTCEFLTVRVADPAALAASAPPDKVPAVPTIVGYFHPAGRPLAIPVESAAGRFTIVLSVVPGQAEYNVLLDRVWFWKTLRQAGLAPTLGQVEGGVEVKVIRRVRRDDILY